MGEAGADEYCCSGDAIFDPATLGDLGASGDLGPAGDPGIEFSGELISECASLRLSGECGCLGGSAVGVGELDLLSGEGDRGPREPGEGDRGTSAEGDGGELGAGGDLGFFFDTWLRSVDELLELELLLLDDDLASPLPSRESSESIP